MTQPADRLRAAPQSHALVVLDMQSVFIAPDGVFANTSAQPVVEAVNHLAARCRDAGLPVIHSRYTLRDDLKDAGLLAGAAFVREGHLCTSSPSSRIDDRVFVAAGDVVVEHHRPSAFFASDLESVLRNMGATAVILAGVSINNAVGATARDAFARDMPVLVAREAVAVAPDEDHAELYLEALGRWTAQVVGIDEVMDLATARSESS